MSGFSLIRTSSISKNNKENFDYEFLMWAPMLASSRFISTDLLRRDREGFYNKNTVIFCT